MLSEHAKPRAGAQANIFRRKNIEPRANLTASACVIIFTYVETIH